MRVANLPSDPDRDDTAARLARGGERPTAVTPVSPASSFQRAAPRVGHGTRTDESRPKQPDPRIALASAGDRGAAQALLSELLPRMRNLVRYLLWNDGDVDDVAQIAMVEILRALPGYRAEGSFNAWSDRITMRCALHYVRKRRADRKRREDHQPELHAVSNTPEQPDEYTLRRETVRLLDMLSEEQRQAVVLHHVLGYAVPQLAEELGIPFETARSRLRLAMHKLREHADKRNLVSAESRGEP